MLRIRKANERGRSQTSWLDSRHSFSFGNYYDPEFMGISVLRVINDDRVAPGAGFDTHGHRDMEIISYVLEGALQHKDSMGNGSVIRAGDVQRMSAGTGVRHSEFNASTDAPVHFLQIWILPDAEGIAPSYEQRSFREASGAGGFQVLASPDGRDGSLRVHQDAILYRARLPGGASTSQELEEAGSGYLHVVSGAVEVAGMALGDGDAAAVVAENSVTITAGGPSEVLLFALP